MDFRDFKRERRIKRRKDRIVTWVRMTDRLFKLLEFIQDFINDRKVVAPRESKRI